MSDSEFHMDLASVKSDKSYKSRSSISSRSDSEKNPMEPETDCVRRRNAMAKLNQLYVLLVDPDCPDHSSLESKNNESIKDNVKINELDKKTLKNGRIPTTLSFRVKRLDLGRAHASFL
ncbi:hypothetical protein TNCV_2524211 [Trichonephila clavipes]|nr:hypothetical protein TNCV_2524211 [Trichonephila clavipes]